MNAIHVAKFNPVAGQNRLNGYRFVKTVQSKRFNKKLAFLRFLFKGPVGVHRTDLTASSSNIWSKSDRHHTEDTDFSFMWTTMSQNVCATSNPDYESRAYCNVPKTEDRRRLDCQMPLFLRETTIDLFRLLFKCVEVLLRVRNIILRNIFITTDDYYWLSCLNAVLTIFIRFLVCFNSLTTSTHTHTPTSTTKGEDIEKREVQTKKQKGGKEDLIFLLMLTLISMFTRSVVCGWWCVVVVFLPEYWCVIVVLVLLLLLLLLLRLGGGLGSFNCSSGIHGRRFLLTRLVEIVNQIGDFVVFFGRRQRRA